MQGYSIPAKNSLAPTSRKDPEASQEPEQCPRAGRRVQLRGNLIAILTRPNAISKIGFDKVEPARHQGRDLFVVGR